MTSLLNDVRANAQWIATALSSSGYQADFTPGSLRDVDRFMDEHSKYGIGVTGGLLATDLGPRLFALGAHVGRMARQTADGGFSINTDVNARSSGAHSYLGQDPRAAVRARGPSYLLKERLRRDLQPRVRGARHHATTGLPHPGADSRRRQRVLLS